MSADLRERICALSARLDADPTCIDALLERGRLYWQLNRRAEAMTDFNRAAALDPTGPGAAAAANAAAILAFCNPDLYNP